MRGSIHRVEGVLHTISPNAYPGLVDTASSSSSASFKKRSVSGRILAETHGNGDLEEDFEAAHLLEQTKKLKITTVPGEIRLMKDVDHLLQIGAKGFEILPRTESCELKLRFFPFIQDINMNMVESIHLPCNFLIMVDKYYPHDRPIVKCLDPGYTCIHINDDGILVHYDLYENWSPICALGDIIKCIQNVRLFVYKLQSRYIGENVLAESQFDTTSISATSMKERVAVEAAYADEEGNMVVDDHYDLESEMVSDEGNTDQSDMQRSVTSIMEDIDDEMFS